MQKTNYVPFVVPGLLTSSYFIFIYFSYIVIAGSCDWHGNPTNQKKWKYGRISTEQTRCMNQQKSTSQMKMTTTPDWPQEFKHGLVDECVPEHRDTSSSSHELLLEPRAKVVSSKHNIFVHFPKERNCYIRITKFWVKDVSLDIIINTLSWFKTWLHNGYNPTH